MIFKKNLRDLLIVAILGLLIPGAGQIWNGDRKKGWLFFLFIYFFWTVYVGPGRVAPLSVWHNPFSYVNLSYVLRYFLWGISYCEAIIKAKNYPPTKLSLLYRLISIGIFVLFEHILIIYEYSGSD